MQGSIINFKSEPLADSTNQEVGPKKTPRPLTFGQPLTDDDTEHNNQSILVSHCNTTRQLGEDSKVGDKSIGEETSGV